MLAETSEFERFTLRHDDHALDAQQQDLRAAYAHLLAAHAGIERVRAVEARPPWFDDELWRRLLALGAATFGLPERAGGDGGGLVEVALAAEEVGSTGAAVALAETAAVGRMLARLDPEAGGGPAADLLAGLRDGTRLLSLAPRARPTAGAQLVPCGSVADTVVGLVGGTLIAVGPGARGELADNLAAGPLAWWTLDPAGAGTGSGAVALADGPAAAGLFARMRREWALLTASALVGVARTALADAVEYARDRHAFGLPIGAYQAVSHPLVDVEIAVTGARRLVRKAAWLEEHEPGGAPDLTLAAISFAAETAVEATTIGVHTLGGMGVANEVTMQLLFRRAKGWSVLLGDPMAELADLFAAPAGAFTGSAT